MRVKTLIKDALLTTTGVTAFTLLALSPVLAYAAPAVSNAAIIKVNAPGYSGQTFTKKKYHIKGDWSVVQENGRTIIRFSESFKTKNGPDLKVFLSPQTVGDVTGKTALDGAVTLGRLKSNKGTQDYIVPNGVSLANFSSVLIHCEAYSVLWGGGSL